MIYKGLYIDKNNKQYDIEFTEMASKDRIDFYGSVEDTDSDEILVTDTDSNEQIVIQDDNEILDEDMELLCTVFREFKPNSPTKIVYYGDYGIFTAYENLKAEIKFKDLGESVVDREMTINGLETVSKSSKNGMVHNLTRLDTKMTYEKIVSESGTIELKAVDLKNKACRKLPGIPYEARESVTFESSTTIRVASLREIELRGKDITWLKGKKYSIINDKEGLLELVDFLTNYDGVIAFDTETTGLSINRLPIDHPNRSNLVGICMSWEENQGIYIPTRHKFFENLDEYYVVEQLKWVMENKHLVTHYGVYDWKVLYTYGVDLNIIDDTYILQYIINSAAAKNSKGLKSMTKAYLGIDQLELSDFFNTKGKRKQEVQFDYMPYEAVLAYAPADTDFTLQLYNLLRPKLRESEKSVYGIEIPLIRKLAYTEYMGVRVDMERVQSEYDKTVIAREEMKQKIYDTVGREFNINSPMQLIQLLYTELEYPILARTKTDNPSTGAKALDQLASRRTDSGEVAYPLADMILKYKKSEKLITGFFNKIFEQNIDGWLFPKYNQAGAESGRIAGYDPNLQQMDGSLKGLIIADDKDYYMMDTDYAQIEYRVMASLAQQTDLIETFFDPEVDFHRIMAGRLMDKPQEQVTSDERSDAKALNFGIPFGMREYSLAINLYGNANPDSIAKATDARLQYLNSVPCIRDMFTEIRDFTQATGYVETAFGRRREFPDLPTSTDFRLIERDRRRAGNTRIQGTAADIMKIAYNRIVDRFNAIGWGPTKLEHTITGPKTDHFISKVRVSATIHDELIFIVHRSINPWEVVKHIRECMELKLDNFSPFFTGTCVVDDWGQAKDDTFEIPIGLTDIRIKEFEEGKLNEPFEDPVTTVHNDIRNHQSGRIDTYIAETLGVIPNANCIETLMDRFIDPNLTTILYKFYGAKRRIKCDIEKKEAALAIFFKSRYNIELITHKDLDEAEPEVWEAYSEAAEEAEEFMRLAEQDDGILDPDVEGYWDNDEIDYVALQRLENKNSKTGLKIIEKELEYATPQSTHTVVFVADGMVVITVDEADKNALQELSSYLKSISKPNGYTVHLKLHGKMMDINTNIIDIDRDKIYNIVKGIQPAIAQ